MRIRPAGLRVVPGVERGSLGLALGERVSVTEELVELFDRLPVPGLALEPVP